MIIKKLNLEEQDGIFLVNQRNLDLAIADANAKGMTAKNLYKQLRASINSYLIDALADIEP